MASPTLHIDIDTPYHTSDLKYLAETHWRLHLALPRACLSIPPSANSAAATLFSSPETKTVLSKLTSSKFWAKTSTVGTLHPIKQIPLIPLIVPISKLYLSLFPNAESPLIEDSFGIIKNIQHAYTEIMKHSTASSKSKTSIEKQKDSVLGDMLTFTSNTLARMFVRSAENDLFMNLFAREIYYTTINIIRVFEFSILDLLLLPEKYQSDLVTPLETDLTKWQSVATFDPGLVEAIFKKSLLNSYKSVYGIAFSEGDAAGTWPSEVVVKKHLELTRAVVQDHLFYCGNHESCGNREQKVKSFSKCSKCKWMRYCSPECQQSHWKSKHRLECSKLLTATDAEVLFKGRRIVIGAEGDATVPSPNTDPAPSSSLDNNSAPVGIVEHAGAPKY